jgi:hypothetical protein
MKIFPPVAAGSNWRQEGFDRFRVHPAKLSSNRGMFPPLHRRAVDLTIALACLGDERRKTRSVPSECCL